MAYDKVVDSAQLDAALTATANAIREKAGNADACAWDASTGFASLIAAIQAGGGGGEVKTGTVTFATAGEEILINHGLGKKPAIWVVFESATNISNPGQYIPIASVNIVTEVESETVSKYQAYSIYLNGTSTLNKNLRCKTAVYRAPYIATEDASAIQSTTPYVAAYISDINKNYMKLSAKDTANSSIYWVVGRTYRWVVA